LAQFFVDAIFHLCLHGMTVEMTYFHAELIQLIVSQSDPDLEVQRYSMKKHTLTVDAVMLEDELRMISDIFIGVCTPLFVVMLFLCLVTVGSR